MTPTQATVFGFDPASRAGSVVLDDGSQLAFSTAAFDRSGLRLLRPGQRVRLVVDETGNVRSLTILTMGDP
jgi:cold shock CspA family protein